MSTLTIEVSDLLTKEEIEERAREILIDQLKLKISRETERLLSNAAYYCAYRIVDDLLTDEQRKSIQDKTQSIINGLSEHTVFRRESWNRETTSAYQILDKTVWENRDKIVSKTLKVIQEFDYHSKLDRDCADILMDSIIRKLEKQSNE